MPNLEKVLLNHQAQFHPILPPELQFGRALLLDMNAEVWQDAAEVSVDELIARTQKMMQEVNAVIAIGRYAEDRQVLYQRSPLFSQDKIRSLHIGLDLTVPENTPIFSPYSAMVHSFADNTSAGDYGPTIILQHELDGVTFFTLYGHLSRASLNLNKGQAIARGQQIGSVGNHHENGGWPAHLHFQIIHDMQGWQGGYPGVVALDEAAWYFKNCPDPNLILNLL